MSSDNDLGNIAFDLPKHQSNVIKVIGIGGGGSNAINHMFQQGIKGVDFVICNTDAQALQNSGVPNKIQLGVNLTEGLEQEPTLILGNRPLLKVLRISEPCLIPIPKWYSLQQEWVEVLELVRPLLLQKWPKKWTF